jgi:hypothetical protein
MKPSRPLSRRAFLAAAGGAIAGLALPHALRPTRAGASLPDAALAPQGINSAEWDFIQPQPVRLDLWGRTTATTAVREITGLNQPVVEWLHPNTVLPLLEKVYDVGHNPNNTLWYRVRNGYVYTSTIQHMKPYHMPHEIDTITTTIGDEPGAWAQTIVPYTLALTRPSGAAVRLEDDSPVFHTYSSVHHVIGVEYDDAGFRWYQIFNDKPKQKPVYVLARHMRIIPPEEFSPINPGANKHMVVTLDKQRIDCYEDDRLVHSCLTSSGAEGWDTPAGDHGVVYKQPSRYMYSDPEVEAFSDPDFFDLPGVPFNTFITTMGHAIHGTYWHGDYGRPRSHGCLNVTPEDACWIFRWTEPYSPYDVEASGSSSKPGTPVVVV